MKLPFMKKSFILASLTFFITGFTFFDVAHFANSNPAVLNDSLELDRAKYISIINERIRGKEKMAVDSVFSNLKVLGGFPAENLVFAMNAWSRGLGVSCGHCHDTNNFSSDEKMKKEIAREMVEMGNMISGKLKTIKGLSEKPIVNCITCHRGETKPTFRMQVK
jgi:hypothetical protein